MGGGRLPPLRGGNSFSFFLAPLVKRRLSGRRFLSGACPSRQLPTAAASALPALKTRQDATCQRHIKGGLAWLAWVVVGEKCENAPARPNGHHRWPRARRACCANIQLPALASDGREPRMVVNGYQARAAARTRTMHGLSTRQRKAQLVPRMRCTTATWTSISLGDCTVLSSSSDRAVQMAVIGHRARRLPFELLAYLLTSTIGTAASTASYKGEPMPRTLDA